jgi:hypothetical protein
MAARSSRPLATRRVGRFTVYRAIERERSQPNTGLTGGRIKALSAQGTGCPVSDTPPARRRLEPVCLPVSPMVVRSAVTAGAACRRSTGGQSQYGDVVGVVDDLLVCGGEPGPGREGFSGAGVAVQARMRAAAEL